MAPSVVKENSKSSNLIIKRLWSKFRPKEKAKKSNENEWVLDSSPDYFYEEKSVKDSSQKQDKSNEGCNEETSSTNKKQKNITTDEKIGKRKSVLEEEKENEIPKSQKIKETKHKTSVDSSAEITYNLNVDHGNVHIGDVNTVTKSYVIQQMYSNGVPQKETKSKNHGKRPAKINAIFESTDKLQSGHSAFLSNHFGKSYREIGLELGISSGQIDLMENEFENNMKDVSFEILTLWMRKNGSDATVGKLCVILWNSKISRAREAVKQLADNIHNFD